MYGIIYVDGRQKFCKMHHINKIKLSREGRLTEKYICLEVALIKAKFYFLFSLSVNKVNLILCYI